MHAQSMTDPIFSLLPRKSAFANFFRKPVSKVAGSFGLPISVAFQPIFDVSQKKVMAYEALARTVKGGGIAELLSHVNDANHCAFDQLCRRTALDYATRLGLSVTGASLCLNINPNAAMDPEASIEKTLDVAKHLGFPIDRLILEVTEDERAREPELLNKVIQAYRSLGMRVAIDDFGAGYAGLSMLTSLEVDIVKIDMQLVRNIHCLPTNRAVVEMIVRMAEGLGIQVIAEGVETAAEYHALRDLGVNYMQGYLLARPGFEHLPYSYSWSALDGHSPAFAAA